MSVTAKRTAAYGVLGALWLATAVVAGFDGGLAQAPAPEARQAAIKEALADVAKHLAGRENEPAEAVFGSIEVLRGFPASRVPLIMQAFATALGTDCAHCHLAGDWADNSKAAKGTARRMWQMTQQLNREVLPAIKQGAVVNCTTCHRGQRKPATELGSGGGFEEAPRRK